MDGDRLRKRDSILFTFCLYEPNQQSGFRNERVILQYLKRIIRMCEEQKVKLNLISSIEVGSTDESENKRLFLKVEEGLKKREFTI